MRVFSVWAVRPTQTTITNDETSPQINLEPKLRT